ncbi:hypothetical protein WA026_010973 [Henosepilachna vigintioctopunctata]|uniref:Uncharacterized protein n=1 Tax=Henosepilachna vigintioctopunctata TaxID=420089 RepID=A0AAW1UWI5_9CUCU
MDKFIRHLLEIDFGIVTGTKPMHGVPFDPRRFSAVPLAALRRLSEDYARIVSRRQSKLPINEDEVESLKKEEDVTGKALSIAKKYYSSVWGFNVDIETH